MENCWIWGYGQTNRKTDRHRMQIWYRIRFFSRFIISRYVYGVQHESQSLQEFSVQHPWPNWWWTVRTQIYLCMTITHTHTTRHPEYPHWTTCTINITGNNLIFNTIVVINTWPLTSHNSTPSLVRFETFIRNQSLQNSSSLVLDPLGWKVKLVLFLLSYHPGKLHLASC